MHQDSRPKRWISALFEHKPLDDRQYRVMLCLALVWALGCVFWIVLGSPVQAVFAALLFLGATWTVYRERQRRMRERALRIRTY